MKKMTFQFKPSREIREFDCRKLIGKTTTITLGHLSDDKKQQYASVKVFLAYLKKSRMFINNFEIHDWAPTLGKEKAIVKRKIKDAYLLEHQNGGRGDHQHYPSYKDYFNKSKKEEVLKSWRGGLLAKIGSGSGDVDRCDLVLEFEGFKVEDHIWDMVAPEEWYSEIHRNLFKFEKGFYKDADEAIHFFSDRPHDDLFGERYFPVIVFSKNIVVDVRSIAQWAKAWSKPIVTGKHIVFGLRCKPGEYVEIINETYKNGGWVARSKEWDWE